MLRTLRDRFPSRDIPYVPAQSALLIVDMQRYFLDESSHAYIPAADAILPGIKKLIETYSRNSLPVIFTRHINTAQNAKVMARWWADLIEEDDPLSEITHELDTPTGTVVTKTQYDAFYDTPLEKLLKKRDVSQVVVCGVMTQLCCETTARSAFVRGFEVFFPVDGSATYDEEFHKATLLNLSYGFATPVLIEELLSSLKKYDG